MQYNESAVKTFIAGTVLAKNVRVVFGSGGTAGQMIAAGVGEVEIGVTERPALTIGDPVPVRVRTAQGTCMMTASGAIAVGAAVSGSASGRVVSGGTPVIGNALEVSTAAGDVIEILRV